MASPSACRECGGSSAAFVGWGVAGGQDREKEQPGEPRAMKLDARYPTPEFMRLLVELGRIAEREDRLAHERDSMVKANVPPED